MAEIEFNASEFEGIPDDPQQGKVVDIGKDQVEVVKRADQVAQPQPVTAQTTELVPQGALSKVRLRKRVSKIDLKEGLDPWMRQEKESEKLYSYFTLYLNIGETRSIAGMTRILKGGSVTEEEFRKVRDSMENYAHRLRWAERADAYDASKVKKLVSDRLESMERYERNVIKMLDNTTQTIVSIQEEKVLERKEAIIAREAKALGLVMSRGTKIILDGYKTIFGEKHQVDVTQKSVSLGFRFKG